LVGKSCLSIPENQVSVPLFQNRTPSSSKKQPTKLQTIRELSEKMESVDSIADAEGMFSEIENASENFIFRIDQCFALYPDFLTNVALESKVIATLQKAEDYIARLKEQHQQHLLETASKQQSTF